MLVELVLGSLLAIEHFNHVAKLSQLVSALLSVVVVAHLGLRAAQSLLVLEIFELPTIKGQRICEVVVTGQLNLAG